MSMGVSLWISEGPAVHQEDQDFMKCSKCHSWAICVAMCCSEFLVKTMNLISRSEMTTNWLFLRCSTEQNSKTSVTLQRNSHRFLTVFHTEKPDLRRQNYRGVEAVQCGKGQECVDILVVTPKLPVLNWILRILSKMERGRSLFVLFFFDSPHGWKSTNRK